jgi:hypothetical protein
MTSLTVAVDDGVLQNAEKYAQGKERPSTNSSKSTWSSSPAWTSDARPWEGCRRRGGKDLAA